MSFETNKKLSEIFGTIADILEFNGDVIYKVRAYRNASIILAKYNKDISELSEKEIKRIPGIGEILTKKIEEYLKTGHIKKYDRLIETFPSGLIELMKIKGLGPKKVRKLYEELKIDSIAKLKEAIDNGSITQVSGFGEKSINNILKNFK